MRAAAAASLLLPGAAAFAHGGAPLAPLPLAWTFEPWVIGAIAVSACLYLRGWRALWRRAGRSRGIHAVEVASFAAGLAVLLVALVSPLDALGAELFAAHMTQHELLMVVAAPLLVLGRPLATWLWALPPGWRRAAGVLSTSAAFAAPWRAITTPAAAWTQHAAIVWTWHAPVLFDAALESGALHALQHASFLASALLFWWTLLPRRGATPQPGLSAVYLFTTMLHTGALGALLTLSSAVWYPPYLDTTARFGLGALEDQQLGGLIMWVPAGALYAAVALGLLARWLRAPPSAALRSSRERSPTMESTSR